MKFPNWFEEGWIPGAALACAYSHLRGFKSDPCITEPWKEWFAPVGARYPPKPTSLGVSMCFRVRVLHISGVKCPLTWLLAVQPCSALQLILAGLLEPHPTCWGAPNEGLWPILALTFAENPVTRTPSITKQDNKMSCHSQLTCWA